jgi:hypothetical protein
MATIILASDLQEPYVPEPENPLVTHLRAALEHLQAAEQCAKELGISATSIRHSLSWGGAALTAAVRMPVIEVEAVES